MSLASSFRRQGLSHIVGESPWATQLRAEIVRVATHDSTVLISGPTGTGKELIARAIHAESPRAARAFVPVDCTSISGTLFASQLFGHRKGAYTGANYEALGCFRAADRGTIFLDEIGELEPELQAKLLRVLQERVVVPVGGHDSVPVDVRIVAATNRDLKKEVQAGRFREDLYYRLAVVPLESVPLNERAADISVLSEHFLTELAQRSGLPLKQLTPGAIELMEQFPWPGNVRQLRHLLEQAVVVSDEKLIGLTLMQSLLQRASMPDSVGGSSRFQNPGARGKGTTDTPALPTTILAEETIPFERRGLTLHSPNQVPEVETAVETNPSQANGYTAASRAGRWSTLLELERQHILLTLEHTFYNQSATARMLGITRQALLRKMKKYNLRLPART